MGKEEAKEMNNSALGSTFEISLRILLLLNEVHVTSLDEQQIGAVDFISVYAADFDLLDENLHGYSNYRFSEYPARKRLVSSAIKELLLDGNIRFQMALTGYKYSIADAGKSICKKLTSNYADEYRIAFQTVRTSFDNANAVLMLREIKLLTITSLDGGQA